MELEILEKETSSMKLEVRSVDDSIVHLLVNELLMNDDVKKATYMKKPSEDDGFVVDLDMKTGRPMTALKKAAENISKEFKQSRGTLQKELKKAASSKK